MMTVHTTTHHRTVQCRDEQDRIVTASVRVDVLVDAEAIAKELTRKALRNKRQRSIEVGGGVVVQVVTGIPAGWKMTGY